MLNFKRDLSQDFLNNCFRCKKASYKVTARKVPIGTKVHNFLEKADYVVSEGQVVLTGTLGEQWPSSISKVIKSYTHNNGDELEENDFGDFDLEISTRVSANAPILLAYMVQDQVEVATSWGDILIANANGVPHGSGDYIIATDETLKDVWVVNGEVFNKTYKIL